MIHPVLYGLAGEALDFPRPAVASLSQIARARASSGKSVLGLAGHRGERWSTQ
jgi:hypothetical protein